MQYGVLYHYNAYKFPGYYLLRYISQAYWYCIVMWCPPSERYGPIDAYHCQQVCAYSKLSSFLPVQTDINYRVLSADIKSMEVFYVTCQRYVLTVRWCDHICVNNVAITIWLSNDVTAYLDIRGKARRGHICPPDTAKSSWHLVRATSGPHVVAVSMSSSKNMTLTINSGQFISCDAPAVEVTQRSHNDDNDMKL